jgi:succinate dehydrogenase/fumarate reductase flavoprotein subunit
MEKVSYRFLQYDTVVVGSGAAAFNAVDWLYDLGRRKIALLTEGIHMGTSRNTGSDKQTYYKLSVGSDGTDSVLEMAKTLFEGEGVDGQIALAEAANSLRCFYKLANLGVDFPTDEYGLFTGYKTDHDPRQRATSAGPLTSKFMTEVLEASVKKKEIAILDQLLAFRLYEEEGKVLGIVCLNKAKLTENVLELVVIAVNQIIWCTGGPSSCYQNVVYPAGHTGMSGALFEAGAKGVNLQEWQYGLASIKFRWNVSGTYQQVLPRYVSIDEAGIEREFLNDYMTPADAVNLVFLKGYQWPFDAGKKDASSYIDLCVYEEAAVKGRRVFMDFRNNPSGLQEGFDILSEEAYTYLNKSNALFGTPTERLKLMNPLAIQLYKDHHIDIETELLEISVCAQHHNGGIQVDANWESSVKGLFVAGEAAGTFGVHRPGGSALNSTQVGSMRAAQHISCKAEEYLPNTSLWKVQPAKLAEDISKELLRMIGTENTALAVRDELQCTMSKVAAQVRDLKEISNLKRKVKEYRTRFREKVKIVNLRTLPMLLKTYDMIVTQEAVLEAMEHSAKVFGSRGSCLVKDENGNFLETKAVTQNMRLVTERKDNGFVSFTEEVSPIPRTSDWFETVWAEHRELRRPKKAK